MGNKNSGRKKKVSRLARLLESIPADTTATVNGYIVHILAGLPRTYRIETQTFKRVRQTRLLAEACKVLEG